MNADGSPEPLPLVLEGQKRDLRLCIICQNVKDCKGCDKLTSTENGRDNIITASRLLQYNYLINIIDTELKNIKYHVNTCYARYQKTKQRFSTKKLIFPSPPGSSKDVQSPDCEINRPKRRKILDNKEPREKPCIICNQIKCKGDIRKLRICEPRRAKQLLTAVKFNNDDVYTRCILYKTIGDVFAADLVYHKNCMTNYLVKFHRDVSDLLDENDEQCNDDTVNVYFVEMIKTLELEKRGYAVSDCRDVLNTQLNKTAEIGK